MGRCQAKPPKVSRPPSTTTSASATAIVDAPPAEVFDFIRRPANHPEISGDESVRGNISGPELLGPGSEFGMSMKVGVPYRMTSKVVEFDEDRVIAWRHFGGHRWRWELEPVGANADPGDRDVRPVDGEGTVRAAR